MDIFQIDATRLNSNRTNGTIIDDSVNDHIPEVRFDGGAEFNLNFFDNPDDSNTQGGYSDPGSVESTIGSSPPPPPTQIKSSTSSYPPPVNQFQCNTIDSIDSSVRICTSRTGLVNSNNGSLCGEFAFILAISILYQHKHPNRRIIYYYII